MSILLKRAHELEFFCIQSRVFKRPDDEESVIVYQAGIRFCPFCGKKLEKLLKKNRCQFDSLYEKYAKYLLDD